ncbi:MAG: hypothetical protein L7S44_03230 [Flavobacteriaceae bacterium]|nr:hypothetical protein [Flavobacteriaceae bacterium]
MKKLLLVIIFFFLFSCSTGSSYVQDFFVPEIPFPISSIELSDDGYFSETRVYDFSLFKTKFDFRLTLDKELYQEVKLISKESGIVSGDGIRQDQYDVFIYDDSDEQVLNDIIAIFKNREGRIDYDLAQILVAFVQSIEYDNKADLPKYSIETLFLNRGDCDDKSILLSKLLSYAGYETCLFIYEKGQHMAVGLKIDDYDSAYKDGFVYIETTGNSPIGKIPEEFAGGVSILDETPVILYVDVIGSDYEISGYGDLKKFYNDVEKIYGEDYFYSSYEGKILKEKISILTNKSNEIKELMSEQEGKIKQIKFEMNELGGCSGTLEQNIYDLCVPLNENLSKKISEYNSLVKDFNSSVNQINKLFEDYNSTRKKDYIKI